jgi:hypothetical protein
MLMTLRTLLVIYALSLIATAAFGVWLSHATADDPTRPVHDQYRPPDCDAYRGLPEEFLDCVYPRPS